MSAPVKFPMTLQNSPSPEFAETSCCSSDCEPVAETEVQLDKPAPTTARKDSKLIAILDLAGMTASTICLIHCLAMPVVIALIPAFAAELFESEWFHMVLAFMVLVFCLLAFIPGYSRHRDKRLVLIGSVGLSLVFFATFIARFWGETAEISLVTVGNLVLVSGHLLNRKLTNRMCCPGESH